MTKSNKKMGALMIGVDMPDEADTEDTLMILSDKPLAGKKDKSKKKSNKIKVKVKKKNRSKKNEVKAPKIYDDYEDDEDDDEDDDYEDLIEQYHPSMTDDMVSKGLARILGKPSSKK